MATDKLTIFIYRVSNLVKISMKPAIFSQIFILILNHTSSVFFRTFYFPFAYKLAQVPEIVFLLQR